MKHSITISVAGTEISIRTDAKPQNVKELVQFVESKITDVKGSEQNKSLKDSALVAALAIADEYRQMQIKYDNLKHEIQTRSEKILSYLEPYSSD